MKKIQIITILFLLFFAIGVKADGIKVSPSVIDEKAKAKDILKYTVKIKNEKANKIELYAILFDILPDGSRAILTPSELDQKTSITKWTSIKRGVISLDPGAEVEVPLQIDVNLTATPGVYHSVIAFSEGSNRAIAEVGVSAASQILVNIEVGDQIVEKAQVEKFAASRNIFTKYPAILDLQIKNNGNVPVTPSGEILIYNRRNQQVGQVGINSLSTAIEKGSSTQFEIQWTNDAGGFGKFKAKLEAEYGNKMRRDLQDTIYFWVFPIKYLIIFGIGLFIVTFLLTFLLFRKSRHVKYGRQADNDIYEDDEDDDDGVINLKN
ncbi:hypothetical protein L6270_05520 [Candidatus Parcubacteria bacterium]|nr:hypothetical protein [Patescibacteria group bacterium]MBU4309418.1 hypothetical protein [Patescibacteria group bacterium]MBU4432657.1 hypothetical protein [Patescibacteria group bacterium]MBU4577779.1 hypothetical protein [Patescibacteria group bacterium]MCG2697464.1 hypothetical protein [Candidatus Parcubacteria bacterium]